MGRDLVVNEELNNLAEISSGMFDDARYAAITVPNTVSIRQNRFWLVSTEGRVSSPDPLKLHFVTLGVKAPEGRTFYSASFDPESSAPPECFSYDGVTPESTSSVQQAQTCAVCPQARWGSASSKLTGAIIPACRSHKDIVVKVLGAEGAWLLRIPPASIRKQWGPLVEQIKKVSDKERAANGKSALTMLTCVVEATFDEKSQGILNFRPMGYLPASEVPVVSALAKNTEAVDQALWGPEGAARAARWQATRSAPLSARPYANLPSEEVQRAVERRAPSVSKPRTVIPDMPMHPAAVQHPSLTPVQAADVAVGVKAVKPNPAPATSAGPNEVDKLLRSMGIFDE